ncbi:putative T7SS-secreted protein [Aeromicrobium fastidiosum]|uniref:Putative T7SS secretion signal domain-containing protein n=1 Tax=Aeromicrobium fastidiosum TaxID=52699 RepID=A0A641AHJ8_9ACTN|nr:hypothetical protein [Aeromicrobium fastidiosum]KAA1373000.1 hypothetical protein ESP62_018075 [Aeromicrobium fastidiosum]MBP2390972.1 uncharacterized protein YukE [Aeromicrobium fastidiosum]
MSARNYLQWELVGEGKDPVPASEYDVEQSAKIFSDQGKQMNDAASLLRQISDMTGWTGEAAKELADKADDAYSDLDKAAEKYVDAGKALSTFAIAVGTARDETAGAVADAVEAEAQRKANATSDLEGVAEPTEAQKSDEEQRGKDLEKANSALSAARTRLVNALEDLDTAANKAASDIKNASEQFKDSKMDDIKGAVSSALAVIVDALQVLAVILAIVIIVLLIIGTGGAFAGVLAVLGTIAFYLGATILALTVVQFLMGDATWQDVAWATLGVIGGGAVLKGAKGATKALGAVRAMQEAKITTQVIKNLSPMVKFAKIVPIKFIRNWGLGKQAAAVDDALGSFRGQLDSLVIDKTLLRVTGFDGVVSNIRQINALKAMSPSLDMVNSLNTALRNVVYEGTGAVLSIPATAHDIFTADGPLFNTIDNIGDLGTHISSAGR